ncbi:repressor [Brevibacillus borstelensis cifa_chp40]|nr:repressor [Brevibacillus borstelensis cifa_chp40]
MKKYRQLRNYSLQDLAERVELTKKTIQRYENGEIKIDMSRLSDIASALEIDISRLLDGAEKFLGLGVDQLDSATLVPVVGRISCGNGTLAFDDIEGYEPTPKEWIKGGEHFYLRAKGDSMNGARIYEGDLLLIRKQPEVENGEIAAVLIGDEAVLKRVYRNGDQFVLQSENPNYAPIFAPPADVKIIGKLKMNVIKY